MIQNETDSNAHDVCHEYFWHEQNNEILHKYEHCVNEFSPTDKVQSIE